MLKKIIKLALVIIVLLGSAAGLFAISKSRSFQFFGGLTNRVSTDEKIVALTFDDAPSLFSNEVINILAEKQIPATFYVIGTNIERYPQEAKSIVEGGYDVGNHSYSHERFVLKSMSFIASEVEKTNMLIKNLGYNREITFRPPNGKKLFGLPWYLRKHNIRTIMWDVEPDTYVQGDAQKITEYTVTRTRPGSIILMHPFCEEICAADREALPEIIDRLHAQGYIFVSISDLLSRDSQ